MRTFGPRSCVNSRRLKHDDHRIRFALLGATLVLAGCSSEVPGEPSEPGPGPSGGGASSSAGGAVITSGTGPVSTTGGTGTPGTSASAGAGGSASAAAGGQVAGVSGAGPSQPQCTSPKPGRAPLRRLTTNEFNNTVADLLGDTTRPGSDFPSEIQGKGFGNDADLQSVSDLLAEKYYTVAEAVAARATETPAALGKLHTCASNVAKDQEETCVRSIVERVVPRAYRRPAIASELSELVELYRSTRALSPTVTFASGVAAVLSAVLQSPDFLYRVEFGTQVSGSPVRMLTGHEVASRLSYFFWQSMPDPELLQAAASGELANREGILTQARRLLDDPKSRTMVRFFFENLLPISDLPNLTRDKTLYSTFSAAIGTAMRQETHRLLEYEIFENTTPVPGSPYAAGSWPAALTTPYTFVDRALFDFYGANTFAPGAVAPAAGFEKLNLNTSERLGLLTLSGMMAGTATTNLTNPVLRGGFIVKHLMCRDIPLPNFAVAPPEPYTGKTARERFGKHSMEPGCAGCHQFMDPIGLALENYDAVGRYRTTERTTIDGVTYDTPIDPSGAVPGVEGAASGPVELVRLLASSEETQTCFATNWMQFAFGRVLDATDDCNRQTVDAAFKSADYNVKELLLAVTQTDAFQYLPVE